MKNSLRFLAVSFLSMVVMVGLYIWVERPILQGFDQIAIVNSEKANEAVTTILTNNVVVPFVSDHGPAVLDTPLSGDLYDTFDQTVSQFLEGTYTRKVKLINGKGMIIYSSDVSDLGEDYSTSDAVIRAIRGTLTTEIDYEENIIGLTGPDSDLWVMATYVPIYGEMGALLGTAEIYSQYDSARLFLQHQIDQTRSQLMIAFVIAGALIIFGIWFALSTKGRSET